MTRVVSLLTLLVFLPHSARAQTVYAQIPAPPSVPEDPTPEEQAVAIEERIDYVDALAHERNWEGAGRAMREAQRVDRDDRSADLGVRALAITGLELIPCASECAPGHPRCAQSRASVLRAATRPGRAAGAFG